MKTTEFVIDLLEKIDYSKISPLEKLVFLDCFRRHIPYLESEEKKLASEMWENY